MTSQSPSRYLSAAQAFQSQYASRGYSRASDQAAEYDRTRYYDKLGQTRFLRDSTSSVALLAETVNHAVQVSSRSQQYTLLAADLAKDIYEVQSLMTLLATITGQGYDGHLVDPQESFDLQGETPGQMHGSLQTTISFLKEHIVATKTIIRVNKRAYSEVEILADALVPDSQVDVLIHETVKNTIKADYGKQIDDYLDELAKEGLS